MENSMIKLVSATLLSMTVASSAFSETVIRYAGTLPVSHHLTKAQEMFSELVSEKTQGELRIEVYPAGQLFRAHDIPTAVATGAVDMGYNLTNVWTSDAVSDINDVPFLFRDVQHAKQAWDPDGDLFSLYTETLNRRQLQPIGVMFFGSLFDISNNVRQLVEPADFEGISIRAYGSLSSESIRALGGSPVTMDPGEMYLGLSQGAIDGAITGLGSIHKRNLWEASEFATIAQAAFGVFAVNMNLGKFNSLPEEHKISILEAGREVFEWTVQESVQQDEDSLAFIEERISVIVLDDAQKMVWAEALEPVVDGWVRRASDQENAIIEWIRGLK